MNREDTTRISIEMDPQTKEWVVGLEKKFNCASHRELYFLALKFLDETPVDQIPFEVYGILESKGIETPRDTREIRWRQIRRLDGYINKYAVKTNKDKETITKMMTALNKMLNDHARDDVEKLVAELKELKERMTS